MLHGCHRLSAGSRCITWPLLGLLACQHSICQSWGAVDVLPCVTGASLPQAAKVAPKDPDLHKKLSECERAVKRIKFEEALSTPVSTPALLGFWGLGSRVRLAAAGCSATAQHLACLECSNCGTCRSGAVQATQVQCTSVLLRSTQSSACKSSGSVAGTGWPLVSQMCSTLTTARACATCLALSSTDPRQPRGGESVF